jgi:hypothetical protein
MNLVRTHWQNLVIGVLVTVIVVDLVIRYKNVPDNKSEEVADASPPAAKATDTLPPAAKATDAAPSASPEADTAKAKELKAEAEKLRAELEKEKALKPLRDEVQGLKKQLQDVAGMTAREALISGRARLGPVGATPLEPASSSKPIIRPRATPRGAAPPATVGSESLSSLPRLPKSKASDVATEDLASDVSKFIGVAEPPLVSYENEEQAAAADNRAKWLAAVMCSDAPASQRVKAAQELSNHPSKGVAQALSFTIGGGRARSLDKFASVREAAAISLGEVGDITFLPLLVQRSKDDPSPEVRKAAYDAAEKVKARASE